MNSISSDFMGFMQAMLNGLFGASHIRPVPPFMDERVLRDIGLLEPEEHTVQAPSEELAGLAKHHALSIGLTGL